MKEYQLTQAEQKLAEIIWDNAPISSSLLVELCEKQLQWKKSTTYTMLKRLEGKGVFENRGSVVRALLTREGFYAAQSKQYVNRAFGGSLPRFLAAFTRNQKLSQQEIQELKRLIDQHQGE